MHVAPSSGRAGAAVETEVPIVPENKDLKRLVRTRMAETGERYTEALSFLLARVELEPLPAGWSLTGDRMVDYEAGLLPPDLGPATVRAARLQLRGDVTKPQGFGALVQSITATHYQGRRVRFSALMRTDQDTDHTGLWLRVDGTHGMLDMDNMGDRALKGAHDWNTAQIVLDVDQEATRLNFGVLLAGRGIVDVADLHLDEVDKSVPTTLNVLPDKPRNLDFGGLTT